MYILPKLELLDGIPVRIFEAGHGDVIVFLHGFCLNAGTWEPLYTELSKDYKIIAIDLPGHGFSGVIPGMHNLDEIASWVNKVLRKLGIEKFVMVGHSLGGYIAIAYTEKFPAKILGLGLFHSLSAADTLAKIDARNKSIRFIQTSGLEPFLKNFYPSLYQNLHPEMMERYIELCREKPLETAVIAMTQAMRDRPDRKYLLTQLKVPVLYVMSGRDELIPKTVARDELTLAKYGIAVYFENAGHLGMMEETDKSLAAIKTLMDASKRFKL